MYNFRNIHEYTLVILTKNSEILTILYSVISIYILSSINIRIPSVLKLFQAGNECTYFIIK